MCARALGSRNNFWHKLTLIKRILEERHHLGSALRSLYSIWANTCVAFFPLIRASRFTSRRSPLQIHF